jgi:beta-ribofuranosylaminobenzene 5'-phosphate synthase
MIKLKTPSRLHLSLIDMNGELGRVDGSVGIALEEPGYVMGFRKPEKRDYSSDGIGKPLIRAEGAAKGIAESICSILSVEGIDINIEKMIPEHVGFGSKTQLALGVAAGICKAYDIHKPVADMARMVGRGGTSGIGVASFEQGGFIVDGGHPAEKGFLPSGFSESPPPPVLFRCEFPWWVVCAWPEAKGAHGEAELIAFRKNCPISGEEAGKAARITLMKMMPSIIEKDLEGFGQALNMLQETGFKKIELGMQGRDVHNLLAFLRENSAGAGMSSFGPLCFGICETALDAKCLEEEVKSKFNVNTLRTKADNTGAKWL